MKRYLLFVIAFVCVSIGAWAGPEDGFVMSKDEIGTWFLGSETEKVIKVNVSEPDGLKHALDKLSHVLAGPVPPGMDDFVNKLNEGGSYVADNKLVLQVVNTSGSALALSSDDISALASINIPTIDLQDLNPASTFTFANPNVKRVILPDGWNKAAVNAAGEALKTANPDGFESTLSQDGANGALVAYVNKPGTLYTALRHTYTVGEINKLGYQGPNNFSLTGLRDFTLLGTPSARDFNGNVAENVKFDPEGHLVFDREADETSTTVNAGIGGTRQLVGTNMEGAIKGADLVRLDLGDAIITNDHCSDLTISWSGAASANLKEIIFPTTELLWTIPADCLYGDFKRLEEVCIPGNIKKLKTRAFWSTTPVLRHVWTTGTTEGLMYDNGAYLLKYADSVNPEELDHYGHAPLDDQVWNCQRGPVTGEGNGVTRFGTITLPEGLELIESHCFSAQNISDVYSLASTAPECHVDAFSTVMYLANNNMDANYIQKMKMVTREAYANKTAEATFVTFLHYPRGIGTPDIQRYTDPTREYSIATTLRDGKGNIIYFPNQSEMNRAYIQGTTGYLWYAWDSERYPEGYGNANAFVKADPSTSGGHTKELQQTANDLYIANQMTNPDKTDRSFYDVRLDADGQPTLAKPGDLDWYYNTEWEGVQLYPEMQSTNNTDDVIGYVQRVENGHLAYRPSTSGDECDFVQDYSYVKQDDGELVWVRTVTVDPNGNQVKDYYYEERPNGEYYHPMVAKNNQDQTERTFYSLTESWVADPEGDYVLPFGFSNIYTYCTYAEFQTWDSQPETAVRVSKKKEYIADQNGAYEVSSSYAEWANSTGSDVQEGVNDTRYDKFYTEEYRDYNASTDAGETLYTVVDNGLQDWDTSYEGQGYDRYHKQYKDFTYRKFDSSKDAADEPRYCPVMEAVYGITKEEFTGDYRGWHQFVLAAYAPYGDPEKTTTVKFYQTDSDWWTVCLPYDLKYSEMKRFFGNGNNIPYLSKLRYVVRDYDKRKITLMFSNNLMVYKENIDDSDPTKDFVHGDIDDVTTWPETNGEGLSIGTEGYDPIILHKGVPYLIKPQIPVGANRSFDVAKRTNPDLYQRLVDAENVGGGALETYIYKGEYTVPAYVVGTNAPEETVAQRIFDHYGDYSKTYYSANKIKYEGQEIEAGISSQYSYTFIGSFFKSVLPHDCYFLGWDNIRQRAAFWYNKTPKLDAQEWNNQTGIICANFDRLGTLIDPATSTADPARWIFAVASNASDNLLASTANAPKRFDMGYGGAITILIDDSENPLAEDFGDQDVLSIDEIQSLDAKSVWYNVNGQKLNGRPTQSGVYIMNGKKYVVK